MLGDVGGRVPMIGAKEGVKLGSSVALVGIDVGTLGSMVGDDGAIVGAVGTVVGSDGSLVGLLGYWVGLLVGMSEGYVVGTSVVYEYIIYNIHNLGDF